MFGASYKEPVKLDTSLIEEYKGNIFLYEFKEQTMQPPFTIEDTGNIITKHDPIIFEEPIKLEESNNFEIEINFEENINIQDDFMFKCDSNLDETTGFVQNDSLDLNSYINLNDVEINKNKF